MRMAEAASTDPRELKRELKRVKFEEKKRKKELKREKKKKKLELKRKRKEAKLRAKLARRGIKLPPKAEDKLPEEGARPGVKPGAGAGAVVGAAPRAGAEIPEAEIISEADKWSPKSARKLDEIQKMIDRMDHTSVKTLRQRYREKYGENLEVPDIYEPKSSIEVETAEETGELEPTLLAIPESSSTGAADKQTWTTPASMDKFGAGQKISAEKKVKVDRPLRFLDYRTPFYLRDKFAAEGGKGKRAALFIIDIILNILLAIVIVKIITTIIYIYKDRKLEKDLQALSQESPQPQPSS